MRKFKLSMTFEVGFNYDVEAETMEEATQILMDLVEDGDVPEDAEILDRYFFLTHIKEI